LLDDLIERDRIRADERLLKFRDHTDKALTSDRAASPASQSTVAIERHLADQRKAAERVVMDALLQRERARGDARMSEERDESEDQRERLEVHRQDTDEQLEAERETTDLAATEHDATRATLARVRGEQARRGDTLALVTHELRSPLSVITINAQFVAEQTAEDATREAALDMTRAAARMERLLSDLLDVTRIQAGSLRIVKRQHDLAALATEVQQSYRLLFEERSMSFTVDAPADPVHASFDHDRIVQVLSNLLGNAMKFTPPNGRVSLSVEANADQVDITVRDNGPGIRASVLPHVFERFWQVDDNTRRGLGLGLFISKKIVEGHGGRIWVESQVGVGTAFRFTIPVA